jgi:outer membrane protein
MKKKVLLITGLVCLLMTGVASAEEKIGYVNVRDIMMNSESGKKAAADIKNLYEKNRLTVQGREAELQKMKGEIEKPPSTFSETVLKEKETLYENKVYEYQALVKKANDDVQTKDQEVQKRMIPEIQKIINEIAARDKYTVILDTSSIPIPFYNKAADLTKRVMEEFNKTYKPKK